MYCPNCGKEITEKVGFCAHCGYEFKERTEIEFLEESLQNSSNSKKSPKKKYRTFMGSILVISLLIVITVSIGVWFNKGIKINERAYEIYLDYDEKFLSVEETYLTDDGYVESDDIEALLDEVELIIQQGVSESVIADYNREDDNIYVKFTSGIQYIFVPYQEDVLSVGNGGQILTLEPNEDDYSVRLQALAAWIDALYNDIPFEDSLWPYANAQLIAETLPDLYTYNYILSDQYGMAASWLGRNGSLRNSNVTVECMKQLGEYAIIIWEGHGAYNESVHSVLVTGESFIGWKEFSKYKNELAEGSLVLTSFPTIGDTGVAYSPVRYYCITSTFVEKYIGEMEQSLLFLGACSSLKDNVLAQAFLDKGTSIVLGYSDETSMAYEMISRSVFFYNLVQNSGTTTVADAYQDTISMVGYDYLSENGNILSYIAQDGIDSRYTLNGILEETITGTITGMVYITENDNSVSALSGVTITVADADGNTVETVETSELSGYTFVLPAGTYTVTAEADGYETVSEEVTLAENDVLNVDFEMQKLGLEWTEYYAEILDLFYYNITSGWEGYDLYESTYLYGSIEDVSYLFPRYYAEESYIDSIGYMLIDLDGNGVPELIIGMADDGENKYTDGSVIYDLYTYVQGEIVHLATSGERFWYELCEDNTIYYCGTAGAASTRYGHYSLNEGEDALFMLECVWSEPDDDWENTYWYYSTSEFHDSDEEKISEDEAYEISGSWPQTVKLELTPFSSYIPKSIKDDGESGTEPDISGYTDLTDYLDSLDKMYAAIGGRSSTEVGDHEKWYICDGLEYGNYIGSTKVDEIYIDGDSYLLYGIYCNMNMEKAKEQLLNDGWICTSDSNSYCAFEKAAANFWLRATDSRITSYGFWRDMEIG